MGFGKENLLSGGTINGDLDIDGDLTVATGNNLSADGLKFPATQITSSDPNTLDDYEEGTWTPVLSDGTNDATSSVAVGIYVKIGKMVHVKGRLVITSLGSVSGILRITGLPFISDSEPSAFGVCTTGFMQGMNIPVGASVSGFVPTSVDYIRPVLGDTGSGNSSMLATEWSATGDVSFQAVYYT